MRPAELPWATASQTGQVLGILSMFSALTFIDSPSSLTTEGPREPVLPEDDGLQLQKPGYDEVGEGPYPGLREGSLVTRNALFSDL